MDDRLVRQALSGFAKLVLNLRLGALVLTLIWLPQEAEDVGAVSVLLLVATLTSVVPVLAWNRIGEQILRHPVMLGPDLLLSIAILATVSVDTPFIFFVLATAMLAGALHEGWGAATTSVALLLAYGTGLVLAGSSTTFTELLGMPLLIPAAAGGGVALRRLLVHQAASARRLADAAMTSAAATERTRLAREMHDSLAKTLHGIALTARTMPRLVEQRPAAAVEMAETVATTAERAAAEARALLVDLRADDLEQGLGPSLADLTARWSERTGIAVHADLAPAEHVSPSSRYELFCIVREALRNVAAHAEAGRVTVTLLADDTTVTATVTDDGRGFTVGSDPTAVAADGHFGIVGMIERAGNVGGDLTVTSTPGRGTTVVAVVPVTAPGDRAAPQRPAPAEPPRVRPRPAVQSETGASSPEFVAVAIVVAAVVATVIALALPDRTRTAGDVAECELFSQEAVDCGRDLLAGGTGATPDGAPPAGDADPLADPADDDREDAARDARGDRRDGGRGDTTATPPTVSDDASPPELFGPPVSGTTATEPDPPPWEPVDPGAGEHDSAGTGFRTRAAEVAAEIAANGLSRTWPEAARNLLHYLGNSGEPLEQDVDKMLADVPEFDRAVSQLETRLALEAVDRAREAGVAGPVTYPLTTDWNGFGYPPAPTYDNQNWFYALGGWQYALTGTVTVWPPSTAGGDWTYEIHTTVHVRDQYNWDGGKSTQIGPLTVTDDELARMHIEGLAQEFTATGTSSGRRSEGSTP